MKQNKLNKNTCCGHTLFLSYISTSFYIYHLIYITYFVYSTELHTISIKIIQLSTIDWYITYQSFVICHYVLRIVGSHCHVLHTIL